MERKKEQIKCFVPALALEHHGNTEFASKDEKIRSAVFRFFMRGDFFEDLLPTDPGGYVHLEKSIFHPKALGYEVYATVHCY